MEINEEEFLIIPEWDSMVENDLCKSYMPVNSILGFEGFGVVSLEAGEVLSDCIGNAVHLLFMVEGSAKVDKNGAPGYLESVDMCLISFNEDCRIICDRKCKLLHFSFYSLPDVIYTYLRKLSEEYPPTHFYPNDHLEQNHLIRSYVQSIIAALESENSMLLTNRYQKLKAYELFHLLFSLYDKSSLVNFFAKLLDYKTDFREFLFQNCDRVKSVNELIQLSGLSRTKFYRCFNREMGISVHRWIQLQKARAIRDAASEPEMTVSDLRARFDFISPGNFVRYCRNYFGCTPSQLIRRCNMGKPVPIVG